MHPHLSAENASAAAMEAKHLDLRGLKCPHPVLRARKAMLRLGAGGTLLLECTDPLSAVDIPHLARQNGFELLHAEQRQDVLVFLLRKPG